MKSLILMMMTGIALACPQVMKTNVECGYDTDESYVLENFEILGSTLKFSVEGFEIEVDFPFGDQYDGITTLNYCEGNTIVSEEEGHGLWAKNVSSFTDTGWETVGTGLYFESSTDGSIKVVKDDAGELCRFVSLL